MTIDLRRLEYFLAVVKEKSFSKAAITLQMTQPPLSQAMAALEREMQAQLLIRSSRGVEPTAAGLLLAEKAIDLLRSSYRLEDLVRRAGQGLEGHLHLACVPSYAWSHLSSLLKRFRHEAPGVEVILTDPGPADVIDAVTKGSADLGIIAPSDAHAVATAHPHLTVQRLIDMPLGIAVPLEATSQGLNLKAADFQDETWIVPGKVDRFPGIYELVEEVWHRSNFWPKNVQRVSTLQTALPLIQSGLGVGPMPIAMRHLVEPHATLLEIDDGPAPLVAALARSADSRPTPVVEQFLKFIKFMGTNTHRELTSRKKP